MTLATHYWINKLTCLYNHNNIMHTSCMVLIAKQNTTERIITVYFYSDLIYWPLQLGLSLSTRDICHIQFVGHAYTVTVDAGFLEGGSVTSNHVCVARKKNLRPCPLLLKTMPVFEKSFLPYLLANPFVFDEIFAKACWGEPKKQVSWFFTQTGGWVHLAYHQYLFVLARSSPKGSFVHGTLGTPPP